MVANTVGAGPADPAIFEAIRKRFPGTREKTYMNVGGRGLLPSESRAALDAHLQLLSEGGVDKEAYFAMVERVRGKFARLINADSDEIAYTKNVSDGLNIIAGALPWKTGDNVVLCRDLEHPNNIYPWLNLRDRVGIEVRTMPDRDGAIDAETMIGAIDRRTRLVTASTVTFAPGLQTDIEPLGRACREKDVFLLVDAAQSVGVIDTDVRKLMVDGLAVATQKGLLGLYGMGFLYCRRPWAEKLAPAALARFGVDLGDDAHEAATGDAQYGLMPAARRFDLGNYNYPAVCAVEPSLDLLLCVGMPAIDGHVRGLTHRLAGGLRQLGLPVAGGAPGPHLAHTVTAGRYEADGNDSAGDPEIDALYRHLAGNGVVLSVRRGMLRFTLHLYNNVADVDRVLALVRDWQADARPGG